MSSMFERFTDRARRVVVLAAEEARRLHHNYIGTEHVLLALIAEGEGVAANALESLGVSLEKVRSEVEEIIGLGNESPAPDSHIPFTPRAKKVLELSLRRPFNSDITTLAPSTFCLAWSAKVREWRRMFSRSWEQNLARFDSQLCRP